VYNKGRTLLIATALIGSMLTADAAIAGHQAEVNDLVGRDAIKAVDIMTSRGFASVRHVRHIG
jgi:hypothetical protein